MGKKLLQATNANPMWWLAVILGAAAAVASFFVGGNNPGGKLNREDALIFALIAVALNPLVWLGAWAFFCRANFWSRLAKCPHCGSWEDMNIWNNKAALEECPCLSCDNTFLKPPA